MTVLSEGDAAAAAIGVGPGSDVEINRWLAETAFMVGAAHAAYERLAAAIQYLEHGLARTAAREGPATPSPSDIDAAELLLMDCLIHLGSYDQAMARITALCDPARHVTTRFTATRAQASIAALRGDDETAHFLLNTATSLANRVPSRFRVALVEGDRAMVLANSGRTAEAVSLADRLLGRLVRPAVGEYQLWSNAEAAAIALSLSRAVALGGDTLTGQRLLKVGEQAAAPLNRAFFNAHVTLARGVNQGAVANNSAAETSLIDALRSFDTYGYLPALAATRFEQGRLAHRRGMVQSAHRLYERAIDEFADLGQPRDVRRARSQLVALAADSPLV